MRKTILLMLMLLVPHLVLAGALPISERVPAPMEQVPTHIYTAVQEKRDIGIRISERFNMTNVHKIGSKIRKFGYTDGKVPIYTNKAVYEISDDYVYVNYYASEDSRVYVRFRSVPFAYVRYIEYPDGRKQRLYRSGYVYQSNSFPVKKGDNLFRLRVEYPMGTYGEFYITIFDKNSGKKYELDPWWNANWLYRRKIVITETSGSDLTDYQVGLNITYDSDMNSDFSDLRFTYYNSSDDSEISIPYWIESLENESWAKVWVKVPEIPASGNSTIYMYYGNPNANSSESADDVFIWADCSADMDKWSSVYGDPISVTTEFLGKGRTGWKFYNDSVAYEYLYYNSDFPDDIVLEAFGNLTLLEDSGLIELQSPYGYNNTYVGVTSVSSEKFSAKVSEYDGSWHYYEYEFNYVQNYSITHLKIIRHLISGSNYNYTACLNDECFSHSLGSGDSSEDRIVIGDVLSAGSGYLDNPQYIYDIRVRKYVSSEPTYSMGVEESSVEKPQYNVSSYGITPEKGLYSEGEVMTFWAEFENLNSTQNTTYCYWDFNSDGVFDDITNMTNNRCEGSYVRTFGGYNLSASLYLFYGDEQDVPVPNNRFVVYQYSVEPRENSCPVNPRIESFEILQEGLDGYLVRIKFTAEDDDNDPLQYHLLMVSYPYNSINPAYREVVVNTTLNNDTFETYVYTDHTYYYWITASDGRCESAPSEPEYFDVYISSGKTHFNFSDSRIIVLGVMAVVGGLVVSFIRDK